MDIDKFELKNLLCVKYTNKIIGAISSNSGAIDNIIVDIAEEALRLEKAKRSEREVNINSSTNLIDDKRDMGGRRRFNLACIDDEPVMVPDSTGFWTPANG